MYIPTGNGQIHKFPAHLFNSKKILNFGVIRLIHPDLYDLYFFGSCLRKKQKRMSCFTSGHKDKYSIIFLKFYNFDFPSQAFNLSGIDFSKRCEEGSYFLFFFRYGYFYLSTIHEKYISPTNPHGLILSQIKFQCMPVCFWAYILLHWFIFMSLS